MRLAARQLTDDERIALINELLPKGAEQCAVCHAMVMGAVALNAPDERLVCKECIRMCDTCERVIASDFECPCIEKWHRMTSK